VEGNVLVIGTAEVEASTRNTVGTRTLISNALDFVAASGPGKTGL
jgi:hypothetical protein